MKHSARGRKRGARRAVATLLAGACAAAALGLASPAQAGGPAGPRSAINARVYLPAAITVAAGQTISWHNETLGPHTVTSTTGLFNSERIEGGGSYSLKFANPGTFDYYCTVHPTMRGVVTVLAIPAERVLLHVRPGHPASRVRIQVARAGVAALLQLESRGGFKTIAHAMLSSQGTASFRLGAGPRRRLRVLVPAAYGQPRLLSRTFTLG